MYLHRIFRGGETRLVTRDQRLLTRDQRLVTRHDSSQMSPVKNTVVEYGMMCHKVFNA